MRREKTGNTERISASARIQLPRKIPKKNPMTIKKGVPQESEGLNK